MKPLSGTPLSVPVDHGSKCLRRKQTEKNSVAADISTLSATRLKEKYQTTYDSWRNRKHAAKPMGYWNPAWDSFKDFLADLGPRPSTSHTLDRIDNDNLNYGPGLCRWADKIEQARNRSSTKRLKLGNENVPLAAVAEAAGVAPATLHKALSRSAEFGEDPRRYRPWPCGYQARWEQAFLLNGGVERFDRFTFLIRELERICASLESWLENAFEGGEPLSDEYLKKAAKCKKGKALLLDAKTRKLRWERAVRIYKAALAERISLRATQYGR